MAGNWIKMNKSLPRDPRVVRISSALRADRLRTVGGLLSAWCVADEQTEDGRLDGYTPELLDELVGFHGLARAMETVGWLVIGEGFLEFPRFSENNGQSSKRRIQDAERKMSARKADKCPKNVPLKSGPDKIRGREDIKNTPPEFCPCSIEQAISQAPVCRMTPEQATHWWNVRNASGWTKGSTGGGTPRRITSWQSDMATSAAWVAESMAKAQGAARVGRGRIVPDIGGRKPSSIANWDDVKPLAAADLEEIEF